MVGMSIQYVMSSESRAEGSHRNPSQVITSESTRGESITGRRRAGCARGYICLPYTSGKAPVRPPIILLVNFKIQLPCWGDTHVFPTEGGAALAAVDISDGMLASGHGPIAGLTFHYIYTAIKSRQPHIRRDLGES